MTEPTPPPPSPELSEGPSIVPATPTAAEPQDARQRFNLRGRSLREHAARGTMINTAFLIGLSGVALVRSFTLAGFLDTEDYGLWGLVAVTLAIVSRLQQVGIGDKYIQQDHPDQEVAFQRAFSLSLLMALGCVAATCVVMPLFALIYQEPKMLLPGFVLSLCYLAGPFQMPIWFHYRRMEFVRQRTLQAVEPIAVTVIALGLAIAGAGYWSLFIGAVAGGWLAAIVAISQTPYRFRWRYDTGTLKEYWSFSGPLLVASIGTLTIAQASLIATDLRLGLAGAGALTLASTLTQFTDKADGLVTGTLYPAICAVRDRVDVLYESFVKSNRLALMWAVPFGAGLSLFCADLVTFGIGAKWEPAVPLLQTFGVIAAIGHLGFNWTAYFRARGDTRPLAVAAIAAAVTFVLAGIPLLWAFGFNGLAAGVALQMLAHLACRAYFLSRLFRGFAFVVHAGHAILPALPAIAVVLAARALATGERSVEIAFAELAAFLLVCLLATYVIEGKLLREAVGYLRSRPAASATT